MYGICVGVMRFLCLALESDIQILKIIVKSLQEQQISCSCRLL